MRQFASSAAKDATLRNYERVCDDLLSSVRQSTFLMMKDRFAGARDRLESTSALGPGWDTYGAEPPNEVARSLARTILSRLEGLSFPPTRVMPSVEGGIAFSFVQDDNRADIEVYNTGEIAAAAYSASETPTIWVVADVERSLATTIDRIRVHLAA